MMGPALLPCSHCPEGAWAGSRTVATTERAEPRRRISFEWEVSRRRGTKTRIAMVAVPRVAEVKVRHRHGTLHLLFLLRSALSPWLPFDIHPLPSRSLFLLHHIPAPPHNRIASLRSATLLDLDLSLHSAMSFRSSSPRPRSPSAFFTSSFSLSS